MALEKVNYWGDMRKGIKDKLERINNITSSNVHGQLKGLLKDLETQQQKLTDHPNKQNHHSSDEEDTLNDTKEDKQEHKKVYKLYINKATEPDPTIFDLPRIQKDMTIFQSLVDEHQREMDEKN